MTSKRMMEIIKSTLVQLEENATNRICRIGVYQDYKGLGGGYQ